MPKATDLVIKERDSKDTTAKSLKPLLFLTHYSAFMSVLFQKSRDSLAETSILIFDFYIFSTLPSIQNTNNYRLSPVNNTDLYLPNNR